MTDLTPTNEQPDARVFDQAPYLARALNWASIDALANTPDYVLAEKLAGCPHLDSMFRAYLAAVPATAPDERDLADRRETFEWFELLLRSHFLVGQPVWEEFVYLKRGALSRPALAARPAPVVSDAAQDERAVDMARAEEWVREAIENAIPDDLPGWRERYTDKAVLGVMAVLTAALAARPAPVVSGEAVKAAAHSHQYEHFDAYETQMGPCVLVQDLPHVLAALGITVADAPAADDEGGKA